mgnify:CR=1 FL=1
MFEKIIKETVKIKEIMLKIVEDVKKYDNE